jgi:hypothetical protein
MRDEVDDLLHQEEAEEPTRADDLGAAVARLEDHEAALEDAASDDDGVADTASADGEGADDDGDDDDGPIPLNEVLRIQFSRGRDHHLHSLAPDEDRPPGRRRGEFVCRSCFLVRRRSLLAEGRRLVCRDCAEAGAA